jgi:hypothetical protein
MINFVMMCDVHVYGKFNKFSTLGDTWHATIQGGEYLFQVRKLKLGDYVYFHETC